VADRLERESAFYRAAAAGLDPATMPPRPPDPYEAAILAAVGDVRGRRVLDAGCGAGDLTLELAARGARLTALDLSEELLAVAAARLAHYAPDAHVDFRRAPLEDTGLADGAYDVIAGKWILHHTDVARSAAEVARLLAPGGRAVFFENHDRNPLLRLARRHLLDVPGVVRVGTEDERPLGAADLATLRATFREVRLEYPSLYFFELLSRQVLRYRGHAALQRADAAVWRRAPALRPYGYHVLVVLAGPVRHRR